MPRPASWVTLIMPALMRADEFTREEGTAAYTHTRLINESSAA